MTFHFGKKRDGECKAEPLISLFVSLCKSADLLPLCKSVDLLPLCNAADLLPLCKSADLLPICKSAEGLGLKEPNKEKFKQRMPFRFGKKRKGGCKAKPLILF